MVNVQCSIITLILKRISLIQSGGVTYFSHTASELRSWGLNEPRCLPLYLWLHGLRRRVTDMASGSASVTNIEQDTCVSSSQAPQIQNGDKVS